MTKTINIILLLCLGWNISAQQSVDPAEEPPFEIIFSLEGGFYHESLEISLFPPPGARIYYTLDGSQPTTRSKVYRKPFQIEATTVIRAIARKGKKRSTVYSNTYFINEPETDLPVVSISIAPYRLFDPEKGLFMVGNDAIDSLWKKPGANFWSRKELRAGVEIFDPQGVCQYNCVSGFRLFGGMSRLFPQKSMAIAARQRYGQKRIRYPIFGEEHPKKFKHIVLRNSGSDFGKAHFRDILMTSLLEKVDLDKQLYQPTHVYINGTYWGLYHIREKVNRFFIAAHHDVDKDSIDLMEHRIIRKRGSRKHYQRLLYFMRRHDMANVADFDHVTTQIEVDNFMDYQIAQIYFDNQDAGGNIKFWRPQTPNGRWRWILYDTDWGFGLHEDEAFKNNSLAFHTERDGPLWPNPPWSTFILRKLLENPDFRIDFTNRFADHLNTTFKEDRVAVKIDFIVDQLNFEIDRHFERWRLDREEWEAEVDKLHSFAQERPKHVRMHLMEYFDTGRQRKLKCESTKGGRIIINENIQVGENPFEGIYFANIPITIRAASNYGYRFSHWEGIEAEEGLRALTLRIQQPILKLRAVFEPYIHPMSERVIINEISANNKESSDWIELFNNSDERLSLKGWKLVDTKNEFVFPDVSLAPNDYMVICEDSVKLYNTFPASYNVVSGMGFGLNKRLEKIILYSDEGALIDSVSYSIPPIDSLFTLNLLLPNLENSDMENWEMRMGPGSPNAPNPYYVESRIRSIQEQWMQVGLATGVIMVCMILLFFRNRGTR